jgi:hypothetical protein
MSRLDSCPVGRQYRLDWCGTGSLVIRPQRAVEPDEARQAPGQEAAGPFGLSSARHRFRHGDRVPAQTRVKITMSGKSLPF